MTLTARLFAATFTLALLAAGTATAETGNFSAPAVKGVRLDWCAHFGSACGKPAADLFCRENGFVEAQRFAIEQNVGARGVKTLVFGDGRFCEGPTCSGFRVITCTRPDKEAPAEAPVLVVKPKPITPKIQVKPLVEPEEPEIELVVPKPIKPKKPGIQLVVPKKPPGKKPPLVGPGDGPLFAMPEGAALSRCLASSCEFAVDFNFDLDPKAKSQSEVFIGDVEKIDLAAGFRWQVATKAFPAFKSGADTDVKPPGLVASEVVTGKKKGFIVDFRKIAARLGRGAPPKNFYVRILPTSKGKNTVVVGQPSNLIMAYYADEPPPQEPIRIYDTSPPKLFSTRVVSFTPPTFYDPNRWGCVVINAYKGELIGLWKTAYPIGAVICPESFKGGSYQITSVGEFFEWVVGGLGDAVDWVSERYEDLKQLAVDIVMKYTPFGQQCELIGELIDEDAPGYCELAAKVAVNAGMAALGVPPSIPNYNELIDKGVDYAVELAANEIATQTGVPCIGPCEDALRGAFSEAADELKRSSYTPGCVGTEEAHKHGKEPLCLPDFIVARPAPGAVYAPPVAVVEVTRLYADPNPESLFKEGCHLGVGINFENQFPATTVFGPGTSPQTKKVPAQKIEGVLYAGEGFNNLAQEMPKGSKKTMTFTFASPQKFVFPWTRALWNWSQIPARDEQGPMGPDWFMLYSGATANVTASINCAAKGHTLTMKLPEP